MLPPIDPRSEVSQGLSPNPGEAIRYWLHQDRHIGTGNIQGVPMNGMLNELLVGEIKAGA
jgi:hypothetical protein